MTAKILHCDVREWIKAAEEEIAPKSGSGGISAPLYEAIKNTCLDWRPFTRNEIGVTFLFPTDYKYRLSIYNDSLSDDESTFLAAGRKILALIIPEGVSKVSGFTSNRNDTMDEQYALGSRLGYKYTFSESSSNSVKLLASNGADFIVSPLKLKVKMASTTMNYAWEIDIKTTSKTPLPFDQLDTREFNMKPASARRVRGGAEQRATQKQADGAKISRRMEIAKLLEMKYAAALSTGKPDKLENPYIYVVTSLLNYLKTIHNEIYKCILPILDYDPFISFYILVEPYKCSDHMLSDEVLFGTGGSWSKIHLTKEPKMEYVAHIDDGKSFPRNKNVLTALNAIRDELVSEMSYSKLIDQIHNTYRILLDQRQIGRADAVIPVCSSVLTADRKMWQDEFRMHFSNAIRHVFSEGKFNQYRYDEMIRSIQYCWCGDDYLSELVLMKSYTNQKNTIVSRAEICMLKDFIFSTDFLYICPMRADIGAENRRSVDDAKDNSVFNRNYAANAMLESMHVENCAGGNDVATEITKIYENIPKV